MRIIQICTADSLGGLELYFATCCKKLRDRGNDVLAVISPKTILGEVLGKDSINCFEVEGGTLKKFRVLNRLLKSFNPDVVHVHHKRDLLIGALLRRFSRWDFRYVHTRQMDLPHKKKNPYHTFLYSRLDLMIAITNRLKDQIVERINIDPEKVTTLYYGVPSTQSNFERCAELEINNSNFNIGVIARIDNKKEQHVIIEALKHLKDHGQNELKVYLVGGSTDAVYFETLKQMISDGGLKEDIVICGFLENPQELMPCFDVVVLTTGNETFGLVLPEAMRMGVAVIGANGGGVPEIIDHNENGLLFEVGSAKNLADQIKIMRTTATRNRLASCGKKKADQKFEINNHFDKLEKLFS